MVSCSERLLFLRKQFEFARTVYEAEDGVLAGVSAGKCLVDCATLTPEHMVRTFTSHEYVNRRYC